MSSIPLKKIENLLDKSLIRGMTAEGGNYKTVPWADRLELYHYGTLILTVRYGQGAEINGGWSRSDADAINSVMYRMGIQKKASTAGGYLHWA